MGPASPARRCARRPARVGAALALALVAISCAKKGPPSGGPPDLVPPTVVATSPDSGAARVPRVAPLSITFSESMEPRSTESALALAPRVDVRQLRWKGPTVTVVLAETLRARQSYTLFVGAGARDRHGNALQQGVAVTFSTGDSFPPGTIEGTVRARGFSVAGTYLWCYDQARHEQPDSTARDFDALGVADAEGRFHVIGLPVPGRYRVWAFADLNGNRSFEPAVDILAPAETTFALSSGEPAAAGVDLEVVNPRAPAKLAGAVLDSLGDSLGVVRVVAVSVEDSTRRFVVEPGEGGGFEIPLAAGKWRVQAFRDLNRNRVWEVSEAGSDVQSFTLEPAGEVKDLVFILRRPAAAPGGP